MTKSHWRESLKSLGSHIDPEKDEQLKKTKTEIDDKVAKIMKLVKKKKNRGKKDGNSTKDSELVELIGDFHKQYQALYALYDNLREEVREKVCGKENDDDSSSTSSPDSESYYSVGEASARSSPRNDPLQKVRDDFKHKFEISSLEFFDLRNKLNSMSEEKEALHSEYMASLSKIQESEKIIKELRIEAEQTESTKQTLINECTQLKEKLVEREKEPLSLTTADQVHESKVLTQIKELEFQVSSLKLEHEYLSTQKRELEEQIEGRAVEAKQLGGENSGLQARILELEMTSKEKEETLSALLRKLEENESNSMSTIKDLMARNNNLQLEVDTLRTQKSKLEEQVAFKSDEASTQVKGVMDQVNVLQQEVHSLSSQKSESESSLVKVTQEISHFLLQIENLKEKLESKTMGLQRMLEEKEGLKMQVNDLELEVDSLRSQKSELEEQMRSKNHDADQLRLEKERSHDRISQLEKSVREKGDELSSLQTKFEDLGNDSCTQIKALGAEVNNLHQELESQETQKTQLELQIEREKQESLESLTRMEKQNIELTSKIEEHQKTLKGQGDVIKKLNEEQKQIRGKHLESKLNYQIAEKKIEETAEEFCKKFEDSLLILSRRIRVAEQLHVESKDVSRKTIEKYEQEHKDLKQRIATTEVAVRRVKDISLTANDMLNGLDEVTLKFVECNGNFLNRISKASCEVLFAKDWVRRKNTAIKHVQKDVDSLIVQLDTKEAEILGLREKVWKLENKGRELEKMVKEKEEGMLAMGEEKREAIRQLCVWIDYHRSRSDYLKKILSQMTAVRSQRTP